MIRHLSFFYEAWDAAKELSLSTKRNRIYFFVDAIMCRLKYGCLVRQYVKGGFYKMKSFERCDMLTDHLEERFIKKINNSQYIPLLQNKKEFNNYFTPFVKRKWLDIKSTSFEDFKNFCLNKDRIVVKPVSLLQGKGIYLIDFNNKETKIHEAYNTLIGKDVIIEECINQHPKLCLNNSSVNTIRVITMIDRNGNCVFLKTLLRAGVGESVVDNFCAGGIIYGIDINKGCVNTPGFDLNYKQYTTHPNSDIYMLGFSIPNWDKVLDICKDAALSIPQCRLVGWDVAVRHDNNVELIEGNHDPDYEFFDFFGEPRGFNKIIKSLI